MIKIGAFITLILILSISPAEAQNPAFKAALEKHNEGRYYQSLEITNSLKSADSFALAARSRLILVRFYLPEEERLENIELAIKDAQKSLELDESHLGGNLQAAVAWGLKARIRGKISDAKQAKKFIDQAIKTHPDSPWGWAALGGWNAEVVQRAGGLLGRIIFKARQKSAFEAFEKSLELAENKIPFYLAYCQALLRTNKSKFKDKALILLNKAMPLQPQNYLDKISKRFAKEMIEAIEKNDKVKLDVLLEGFSKLPESDNEVR